jgi:hypothetical protein
VGAIPRNIDITPFDTVATVDCMVYLDERSMVTLKEMFVAYDYQPAYSSPSVVDSATGALLMNLTHLFMFEHEPKVLPTPGSLHFYEVVTTATLKPIPRLCLFASTRLQIEVGDHVFTFPMKEQIEDWVKWEDKSFVAMPSDYHDDRFGPRGLMYLILRPMPNQQGLPAYKLVTSRIGLCATYPHMIQEHHSSVGFSQSDWPALRNLCTLRLSEAQTNVQSTINSILKLLIDAMNTCLLQGCLAPITRLPTQGDAGRNQYAADLCEAFYDDYIAHTREGTLGSLGALLIQVRSFVRPLKNGYQSMMDIMREFLVRNNLKILIDTLTDSFEPPKTLTCVLRIISDGPMGAEGTIGIPKYINGFKVDGQIMRVAII